MCTHLDLDEHGVRVAAGIGGGSRDGGAEQPGLGKVVADTSALVASSIIRHVAPSAVTEGREHCALTLRSPNVNADPRSPPWTTASTQSLNQELDDP